MTETGETVWKKPDNNILEFFHFEVEGAEWRLKVANEMLDVLTRLAQDAGDETFWRKKDKSTALIYGFNPMAHPAIGELMSGQPLER